MRESRLGRIWAGSGSSFRQHCTDLAQNSKSSWEGERNLNCRTAAGAIRCADLAVVELHCPFRNRKTNTESAGLRTAGSIDSMERAENRLDLRLRNARASIANLYRGHMVLMILAKSDLYLSSGFRIAHCVAHNIFDCPVEELAPSLDDTFAIRVEIH